MTDSISIAIVGAGNVATNLALSLFESGVNIRCVYSRNAENTRVLATKVNASTISSLAEINPDVAVIIIAVSDDEIGHVAHQLHDHSALVVHCSGSVDMDVLSGCENYGVFYPFVVMRKAVRTDFTNVDFFIEANDESHLSLLKMLAEKLTASVKILSSKARLALHISGVFSNNFVNLQFIIAQQLLNENGMNFDVLRPMLSNYFQLLLQSNPAEIQTGPAIRHDDRVIQKHLELLAGHSDFKEVYRLLTAQIQKLPQQ
jgi:predicted short-subunit dehydrogenase-like oxidoreductase (DUF2520 family)